MIYLAPLSPAETLQRFEKLWKEAVVAYFEMLFLH
jgi:hypothetical protein